ncbi:hypothetical protein D3C73_834530 [compost metagenome]
MVHTRDINFSFALQAKAKLNHRRIRLELYMMILRKAIVGHNNLHARIGHNPLNPSFPNLRKNGHMIPTWFIATRHMQALEVRVVYMMKVGRIHVFMSPLFIPHADENIDNDNHYHYKVNAVIRQLPLRVFNPF